MFSGTPCGDSFYRFTHKDFTGLLTKIGTAQRFVLRYFYKLRVRHSSLNKDPMLQKNSEIFILSGLKVAAEGASSSLGYLWCYNVTYFLFACVSCSLNIRQDLDPIATFIINIIFRTIYFKSEFLINNECKMYYLLFLEFNICSKKLTTKLFRVILGEK